MANIRNLQPYFDSRTGKRGFGRTYGQYSCNGTPLYSGAETLHFGSPLLLQQEWSSRSTKDSRPSIANLSQRGLLSEGERALHGVPGGKLTSLDAQAWSLRAVTLYREGRYVDALNSCDKALALNPMSFSAWWVQGNVLTVLKSFDASLEAYECALSLVPDSPYLLNNKAVALYNLGRHQEALIASERSLSITEKVAELWNTRGLILTRVRTSEELANDRFSQELRSQTFSMVTHNTLTSVQRMAEKAAERRREEALSAFELALGLDSNLTSALVNKANLLLDVGIYSQAHDLYKQALKVAHRNPKVLNNMGCLLALLDRFDEALEHYNLAIAYDSHSPVIWSNILTTLKKLDLIIPALNVYDEMEALDMTVQRESTGEANLSGGFLWFALLDTLDAELAVTNKR